MSRRSCRNRRDIDLAGLARGTWQAQGRSTHGMTQGQVTRRTLQPSREDKSRQASCAREPTRDLYYKGLPGSKTTATQSKSLLLRTYLRRLCRHGSSQTKQRAADILRCWPITDTNGEPCRLRLIAPDTHTCCIAGSPHILSRNTNHALSSRHFTAILTRDHLSQHSLCSD